MMSTLGCSTVRGCLGLPPLMSARPRPTTLNLAPHVNAIKPRRQYRIEARPCSAAAAKKRKAAVEPQPDIKSAANSSTEPTADETPIADPATDVEQGAAEEGSTPIESAMAQLLRNAFESGDPSKAESAISEAEELVASSTARADAAEISSLASQATTEALNDKYLRLSAEFENFRKRSAQDQSKAVSKAKARVIEDLLPVVDAFEAAAGQVKTETEGEQRITASYQGLYAKLVEAFRKMGLEVVPGVGQPFDPEVHEAIMRAPSDKYPDGTVLQEFRRGFKFNGQLLRAAMVQVSHTDDSPQQDDSSAVQ